MESNNNKYSKQMADYYYSTVHKKDVAIKQMNKHDNEKGKRKTTFLCKQMQFSPHFFHPGN